MRPDWRQSIRIWLGIWLGCPAHSIYRTESLLYKPQVNFLDALAIGRAVHNLNDSGVVLPPGISISAVTPAQAAQKKSLQCLVCHRAFMTQSALMSHMLVHQAGMGGVPGGMQMSQQAYLALPSVESTMNR